MGKSRLVRTVIFFVVALTAIGLMLHNLPHNEDPAIVWPTDTLSRLTGIVGFFFCFFGNLIPFSGPACLAGIVIVLWGLSVCRFAPRYRGTSLAIFAFLAFLVANILVAAAFRGYHPSVALAGRYRLIPAAILVSLTYLTLIEWPLKAPLRKTFVMLAILGIMLLASVYAVRGVCYNSAHKASLEAGLAQWPASVEGLDYSPAFRQHASDILSRSVSSGVYAPLCAAESRGFTTPAIPATK